MCKTEQTNIFEASRIPILCSGSGSFLLQIAQPLDSRRLREASREPWERPFNATGDDGDRGVKRGCRRP